MRIGRDRRRHVDEEAIERLRLLGRRQQIKIVALAHRLGLGRRQDVLVAHHQGRPRPGRHAAAAADRGCWRRADSRRSPARAVRADRARPGAAADRGAAARCAAAAPPRRCVQPCTSSETSTTTKPTSKNSCACGKPTSSGIDARKMPTAPRRPTQEMNSFSRQEKRNGARHRNTATGRANSISVARDRERRQRMLGQPVAARPAGRAARTSRSGRARSPHRETPPRCCGRASAGCRPPGRRDRRRESPRHARTAASPKITSALVATNGACRPCASPSRLSA